MFDPIEVLHQYVSYPSVSTDPDFQEGMVGAQNFIANLLENIGHPIMVADVLSIQPDGAITELKPMFIRRSIFPLALSLD